MGAYYIYSQLINPHISATDNEVIEAFRKLFKPDVVFPQDMCDRVLKEHHAAQQLVRDLRL